MHTVWVRLNAVVFFGLTVLLVLAVMTWFSTFIGPEAVPIIEFVKLNSLRSLRSHGGVDRALISFDLRADLAAAFDWNIKQLFVFVVAEYTSPTNPLNQVTRCHVDVIRAATPRTPPSHGQVSRSDMGRSHDSPTSDAWRCAPP